MYNLPYFKAENPQQVIAFMHQNPFVILTGCDAHNRPVATHIPVMIHEREGKIFLQGHIMKQTDHHQALLQNQNVLAIFTGPHTYVSASWYTDKKQASTWNYVTVHAKGTLTFKDENFLLELLQQTTAHFEKNPASPSLVQHLPEEYVAKLMKAIEAFEIEVTDIDHVFKLSQNRDEESYQNIIEELSAQSHDAAAVAILMQKIKED